jgi:hypothetical protein
MRKSFGRMTTNAVYRPTTLHLSTGHDDRFRRRPLVPGIDPPFPGSTAHSLSLRLGEAVPPEQGVELLSLVAASAPGRPDLVAAVPATPRPDDELTPAAYQSERPAVVEKDRNSPKSKNSAAATPNASSRRT